MAEPNPEDLSLSEAELKLRDPNSNPSQKVARMAQQLMHEMKTRKLPEPKSIRTAFRLDDLLGGGFSSGRGIVEITGEASTGKTQLLLDIALSCRRKVAYIMTEGRFPDDRLAQLVKNRQRWPYGSLDDILVSRVADVPSLMLTLDRALPNLLKTLEVDAIIIDSITWPFRVEDGSRGRTKLIQDVVRKLHTLSKRHNLLVVCANHVADDPHAGITKPCLGQSWAKGISGRLFLRIKDREQGLRSVSVDWCEDYLHWNVGSERDFFIRHEGLVEA